MIPSWKPTASLANLQQRARLLAKIRKFFADREVLEVETPLLALHSVTDPHMEVIAAENPMGLELPFFLQTSPEYAMKRLLAAGSGPVYQLAKAFRKGERGNRHNPEFTMLEWYRPDFDDVALMDEVESLLTDLLALEQPCERLSYRDMFQRYLQLDPHQFSVSKLQAIAKQRLDVQMQSENRDDWLNLLLAEIIEPQLGLEVPVFIYDYPASQSALAKTAVDGGGVVVAKRFELYYRSIELANGYDELTDAAELRRRFEQDQVYRQQHNKDARAMDENLLAAMEAGGLPSCAGVALGVDRLLMLAVGADSIDQVIAFPADRS